MRFVTLSLVATALASAAEYSPVDPPNYVPDKPPALPYVKPADLAAVTKLVELLQGYGAKLTEPVEVGDGYLTEQSYPESYPDLSKILKAVLPKSYGLKSTYKLLDRLPGLYGNVAPYGLNPALVNAAYRPPALGLLPPYAQHPLNLLYPPGSPAYHLPTAPKLPLAGAYGLPGYAPHALGLPGYGPHPLGLPGYAPHPLGLPGYAPHPLALPGYAPPTLPGYGLPALPGYGLPALPGYGLPQLPVIIITKEVLELLKAGAYEADYADAAYVPKPKKIAAKPKKVAAYSAVKPKVHPKPAYAKPAKVAKLSSYAKPAKPVAAAKAYPEAAAPAAAYDAEVKAPIAVVPDYAAAVTEPSDASYTVEARAATGGETKTSSSLAGVRSSAKNVDSSVQSSPEGGESARSSLTDHGISSQKTISRIS